MESPLRTRTSGADTLTTETPPPVCERSRLLPARRHRKSTDSLFAYSRIRALAVPDSKPETVKCIHCSHEVTM